jgi:hypothetical protein
MREQSACIDMPEQAFGQLKQRVVDHWSEVQAIAATVPDPKQIAGWLSTVGGAFHQSCHLMRTCG